MAIFDNELIDNVSDRTPEGPRKLLPSPTVRDVDVSLGGFEVYGNPNPGRTGLNIDQLSEFSGVRTNQSSFSSPVQMVPRSELLANQRYSNYQRNVDLENVYGLNQTWTDQLANGIVKMAGLGVGTFIQGFATIPNTIAAFKNGKLSDLSGGANGYESAIDTWTKNLEDAFPNYYTREEQKHPYLAMVPFAPGSANFWGDKVIKNLGFTAGAIGSAIAQDAAIGAITEGIGALPLISAQLGRASLFLNKIFAGTNNVEKALDIAKAAGVATDTILDVKKLGDIAAYTKITDGFRYGMSIYGSARTEAAIEARDSYRTVREELLRQYKLENVGEEPTGAAAEQIEDYATSAMNTRFGINMALLTASNAIQFGNLFKSFSSANKAVTGQLTKELEDFGKIGLKEGSKDVFEAKIATGLKEKVWDSVRPKLANILTEGVYEEGGQYATEKGTYDYFTRKYKNLSDPKNKESWDTVNETVKSTLTGLKDQFGTSEGLENMMVGAISALISGGIMGKIDSAKKVGKDARLQSALNILNQYGLTGILSNQYENTISSAVIAKEMDEAAKSGDVFKYKNLKNDMLIKFVQSRIPTGMHDVTIEQLNMLKDLDKEEFQKTFGMDFNSSNKSTVNEYVDSLINEANNIKKISDSIDFTFKNPFKRVINPLTDEEAIQNNKHNDFNDWKSELTHLAAKVPHINNRLESIQQSVSQINPSVSNELISKLTNKESLKELSSIYEEKANQLNKTITEFTSIEDKRRTKDQVKALRTASEKINLGLKDGVSDKMFDYLLNFELNNQDPKADRQVGPESAFELFNYGHDINRNNALKSRVVELYDNLTGEKGFNKFMDQADQMRSGVVPEETKELPAPVKVGPQFTNKAGVKENFEEGAEYEIPVSKKARVDKIADDRFQVTAANGDVTFYDSKEKADAAVADINEELGSLQKVKVIAINDDGTIKVEDINGDIYNIEPDKFDGYERILSAQEKMRKIKSDIDAEQAEIESRSGIIATGNLEDDVKKIVIEDAKKDASILFTSDTGASEDWEAGNLKAYSIRRIEFLNNVKLMPNRAKLKTILVTPKQKIAGLEDLPKVAFDGVGITETEYNDPTIGLVASIFVEQDGNDYYYVNVAGRRLAKVGEPVDVNTIVFGTMPTASLTGSKGQPRYRSQQKAQAEQMSKRWQAKRQELFNAPEGTFQAYSFSVSMGIPEVTDYYATNHVGDNLVPEKLISTQQGLIQISTNNFIAHQGRNVPIPSGRPALQFGETLMFLNNRKFVKQEAEAIFEVFNRMANQMVAQFEAGEKVKINRKLSTFLQSVLYWRKSPSTSGNQFYIDTDAMNLFLGGKSYDLTNLEASRDEIIDQIQGMYNNVNNKTLEAFGDAFTEYYMKEGKLVTNDWTNYQSYLLSGTFPNGSSRSTKQTFLTTAVVKPTEAVPYNFKQKYAILHGLDLPEVTVKKEPVTKTPPPPGAPSAVKIGDYVLDGQTKNVYNLNNGPVEFVASIDADNKISLRVESNDTTRTIADDKNLMASIVIELKKLDQQKLYQFDASKEDEALALDFIVNRIIGDLEKQQKEQAPPPVVPPAPVVPVVSDKKADIEKRRQEELSNIRYAESGADTIVQSKSIDEEIKRMNSVRKSEGTPELSREEAIGKIKSFDKTTRSKTSVEAVNAKYDAELAALEGAKPAATGPKDFGGTKPPPNSKYRRVGADGIDRISDAEIELFKIWAAENVPNIPYEISENILITHDNEKAWGAFENGVAKFYKSAARGTEYHEIGEGVWIGFLTPEQRQAILDEFKAKKGEFKDRQSGKMIAYADATDTEAKERIMDDFADFKIGKLPARSIGEKILKFFRSIIEFFKKFVQKPSLKEQLFKAIDTGAFKERTLPESVKNEFAEYRAVEGLNEKQTREFVEDMTARTFQIIFRTNTSLFSPEKLTAPQIFDEIKEKYEEEGKLDLLGETAWNELVSRTKDFLRTFKIEFDDNNQVNINDENYNNRLYAPEAFSVDFKKQSPYPVKLLLGTLTETVDTNQENSNSLELPEQKTSSIVGYKLLNFSRAFVTVLEKLTNTTKISKFVDKLIGLAKADSNYVRLFSRLKGTLKDKDGNATIDFSNYETQDWRLFINFYQTFTKQKPEALIQYLDAGEVYTAPANLFTVIKQTQKGWIENMKALSKNKDSLIEFDSVDKVYRIKSFEDISVGTPQQMVEFLSKLGVEFPINIFLKLKEKQQKEFITAVGSIYTYLQKANEIMSVTGETLDVAGQYAKLAELYINVTNPLHENTYRNVEDKQTNAFADSNTPSVFESEFNDVGTLDELLQARPELNDVFSKNSVVLKKGGLFFDKDGKRIKEIKVKYIQGVRDNSAKKGTPTDKLGLNTRSLQEVNQNMNGDYYVLIPADSSTEWMMNLGNIIPFEDMESGDAWPTVYSIFRGYLEDDIALAKSNRKQLNNVAPRSQELRFFKDILPINILGRINDMILNNESTEDINAYISDNISDINESIKNLVSQQASEINLDPTWKINNKGEIEQAAAKIDSNFLKKENLDKYLSEKESENVRNFLAVNYMINNIEYHKILFGDPYQFAIKSGKLDETKRIKSFLSPRRLTVDFPELNSALNRDYNKAGKIDLDPEELGYHTFKPYTNTVTISDVEVVGSLANINSAYAKTNEADAASWITDNTYREVKIKNGQWTPEAEAWHQHEMAYTRLKLQEKGLYQYKNLRLREQDVVESGKPSPKFITEVLKPIVSGNKFNKTNFDLVLDKFSQMPLYYSMVEGTNLEKLYTKMFKEKIGYVIMESGRKVGAEGKFSLYNSDGSVNDKPFNNLVQVPWKAYGIQVENAFEEEKSQTRGSQLMKIATLDLYDNGKASPEAKEQYERHLKVQNALHRKGYIDLLNKLGIQDLGDGFKLIDNVTVSQLLEREMLRRELSDNAKDTVRLDEKGQFRIPFEASPAYVQIRNILFSMVDKSLVSPKMNGGAHVQIPATGWESSEEGRGLAVKRNGKWVKINREAFEKLSDEEKSKVTLTDTALKFYTKDAPYCEVLLPHWFKEKFAKSKFSTDEKLMDYLNKKENESILKGIGFRIPTQSLSSVEVFKVKGFLPQSMGATVVVPSEITVKAGSDFDIDKLNMYLKNTYVTKSGDIKQVPFFGIGEEAMNKVKEFIKSEDLAGDVGQRTEEALEDDMNTLAERLYKQSLENEYFDSLESLLTLPENFERLITPVSDGGLKKIAEKLDDLRNDKEENVKNKLISRKFMNSIRHAFVTGKKWVGIAAVNITGQSLTQKSEVYIDPSKFVGLSKRDQKILGDFEIVLPHNTVEINGQKRTSISGVTDATGKTSISEGLSGYATSFVDVAKDPYILKVVQSDLAVGTFMFLQRIGVPMETAAMFMNQPIISEYLKHLDFTGEKNLFRKVNVDFIKDKFFAAKAEIEAAEINLGTLDKNIGDYYNDVRFDGTKNAEQQKIFDEFLKYAKMGEFSFKLTQASNYDTTKFKSGDTLFKKQTRTDAAREINIFSSVDKILNNTFIGEQAYLLDRAAESLGEILKLDQADFEIITNSVLKSYAENEFLSADKYDKIANKLKASFLDYVVQIKSGINADIENLLVEKGKSVADKLAIAKKDHPEVTILKDLKIESSDRVEGAKSVKLAANLKEAYDENYYTGLMREMRDNPATEDLYNDIVTLSLLQGTYQSAISIRNIIPIEDFSKKIAPIISTLVADTDVRAYSQGWFQRNNWKDNDIWKTVTPKFFIPEGAAPIGVDPYGNDIYQYTSIPYFPNIKDLEVLSSERRIMTLSETFNFIEVGSDFVLVPRVIDVDGEQIDIKTGKTVTASTFAQKKAKGDLSLKEVYGYKKVKFGNGEPLTYTEKNKDEEIVKHVYKLINLYGDGALGSEYYLDFKKSVLDNGTVKIDNEIPDADIINYFAPKLVSSIVVKKATSAISNIEVVSRYTDADVKANPNKIYVFGDNTQRIGTGGQAQIRNNSNSMGIATKLAPSMEDSAFMTDKDLAKNKAVIDGDIAKIKATGKPVVFPKDGLGTGLAKLKEKAPQTYAYLKQRLLQEFGFDNDKGTISQSTQVVSSFEELKEFTAEQKTNILATFAQKYGMTEAKALAYINEALSKNRKNVIDKLKECY